MKNRDVRTNSVLRYVQLDGTSSVTNKTGFRDFLTVLIDYTGPRQPDVWHAQRFQGKRVRGTHGFEVISTIPPVFNNSRSEGCFEDALQFPQIGYPDSSPLWNRLVSDIADQCRGSLDLSVDLAQSGQVKSMLRNTTKVVELARNLRKVPLRTVGSKWLELQYGWKPLLSSIYGTYEELHKSAQSGLVRCFARTRDSDRGTYMHNGELYDYYERKMRAEMEVFLKPSTTTMQTLSKYTSLNPVSIAWELMPYSFVVDWFINIGGYVRNLETAIIHSDRFAKGRYTFGAKLSGKPEGFVVRPPKPGQSGLTRITHGNYDMFYKDRQILASYPFPRKPVVDVSLGSGRLLNAAALLSQFLRR